VVADPRDEEAMKGVSGVSHALYDHIGRRYTSTRLPDRRIDAVILDALGDADTVVNVGAGAGAYEPVSRSCVAVEPSGRMIRQRSQEASLVIQASAEALPFRAGTFDAALAVLTLHHWTDWRAGLSEMKRVASRCASGTMASRRSHNGQSVNR